MQIINFDCHRERFGIINKVSVVFGLILNQIETYGEQEEEESRIYWQQYEI